VPSRFFFTWKKKGSSAPRGNDWSVFGTTIVRPGIGVFIGAVLAVVVVTSLANDTTNTYLLNGKGYPLEVAVPHRQLPSVQRFYPELLKIPGTNDVLGYETRGISITGRVEQARILVCSNGLEMHISTQTVQRVFQSLAEMDILLHSPQQPPDMEIYKDAEPAGDIEDRLMLFEPGQAIDLEKISVEDFNTGPDARETE